MKLSDEQVEQIIRQVTDQVLNSISGDSKTQQKENYEVVEPAFRNIPRSAIVRKVREHMINTRNVAFTPYEVADIIDCGKLGAGTKDVYALRSILDTIAFEHKDVSVGKSKRTYYYFDNLCYEIK